MTGDGAYYDKPVWLVGLRTSDLALHDLGYSMADENLALDGAWSVWVASGAGLAASGGLGPPDQQGPSYASILALPTEYVPIHEPTPAPTLTPSW